MAKQFDLRKQLKLHDKSLLGRLFAGVDEMCDIAWDSLKPREDEPIVTAWEVMGEQQVPPIHWCQQVPTGATHTLVRKR